MSTDDELDLILSGSAAELRTAAAAWRERNEARTRLLQSDTGYTLDPTGCQLTRIEIMLDELLVGRSRLRAEIRYHHWLHGGLEEIEPTARQAAADLAEEHGRKLAAMATMRGEAPPGGLYLPTGTPASAMPGGRP